MSISMSLNWYGDRALANQRAKGFETPYSITGSDATVAVAKLMLVVTELAEATEAIRDGNEENLAEEIADTIIRIVGFARGLGIDLDAEVVQKMTYNENRPHKHGRKNAM